MPPEHIQAWPDTAHACSHRATLPETDTRTHGHVTYWSARRMSQGNQAPAWGGRGKNCCGLLTAPSAASTPPGTSGAGGFSSSPAGTPTGGPPRVRLTLPGFSSPTSAGRSPSAPVSPLPGSHLVPPRLPCPGCPHPPPSGMSSLQFSVHEKPPPTLPCKAVSKFHVHGGLSLASTTLSLPPLHPWGPLLPVRHLR